MAKSTGRKSTPKSANETPVMVQHALAKAAHPSAVVFFRLGDFYEMFGDDAVLVARELGLTLTSRNRGKPDEIPMAGVPHHAAHGYIARLLDAGHQVAICEQMADPSTVRGIVPRQVVRVITPGTWTDAELLNERTNNWLVAVRPSDDGFGLAFLDVGTAEVRLTRASTAVDLLTEFSRLRPSEVLLAGDDQSALGEILGVLALALPKVPVRRLEARPEASLAARLDGLDVGSADALCRRALADALDYAASCFLTEGLPIFRIVMEGPSEGMVLDRAAVSHLELTESNSDDPSLCLLGVIDRTVTSPGARLIRRRLLGPLVDPEAIRLRLAAVRSFTSRPKELERVRELLSEVGDLERLAARASRGETSPRDLGLVRRSLAALSQLGPLVSGFGDSPELGRAPDLQGELLGLLDRALVERPSASVKEGSIFRLEYDAELSQLAALRDSGAGRMITFEDELRANTGIGSLKVRHTRVFGWYVEVGRSHAARVPAEFRRKQTVATGERFTLDALDEIAAELVGAEERFQRRQQELLSVLAAELAERALGLHLLAAYVARVDVAASLARVALDSDFVEPTVDASGALELVDARHPVVERSAKGEAFVPNDVKLEAEKSHLWVISGPNMAGKSTFLRQVALAVILAQMGSFVPARRARVGVCDRVLSRVGASDNLAGGESTFLVEMRETAHILRTATARSLVILDEVGRGTSTHEGLAIAWAVAEHLDRRVGARTLFATHYHELTALPEGSPTAMNVCVTARQHEGRLIFLHRVVPGRAEQSYGIEVAELAGVPRVVLERAREVASAGTARASRATAGPGAYSTESASRAAPIVDALRALDVDRTTGLDALALITKWKKDLA